MKIRVADYNLSASPLVQAFVNVEIDGWLRLNGLNLLRDGTLKPAQLSAWRDQKRAYWDAVQILDAGLSRRLTADILAAIHTHIARLPAERRQRPPVAPQPREPKLSVLSPSKHSPPMLKPLPPPARLPAPRGPLAGAKERPQYPPVLKSRPSSSGRPA